jgi:hypothetical protein
MGAREQPEDQDGEWEAEALQGRADAGAWAAAERFDPEAMIGHPADEARAYYLALGFPVVMIEAEHGSSVLSLMRERVRLRVSTQGIVVEAFLG